MRGLAATALLLAAPKVAPPKPPPLAPLPMLPSVAKVRVEVMKTAVVVTEDVLLPRGDWKNDALDFYVAFGGPGAPHAFDAHLLGVADGALEPAEGEAGESVPWGRAPRRPDTAYPLLGRDVMAGVVVHLKKESLAKAFAPGAMATLRLRTVLDLPEDDPSGGKSVLVRLGAPRGSPLTLGRIVVVSAARAEAHLCGPEADPAPLALLPRPMTPPPAPRIAPVLAVRHATDDLCVRFFSTP
ncbi:MAG: hypothetical protein JST00_10110 [Deltaproteobacteria bacterium]|nr:hypothetical protein [Deltaproteobacteria bacterium]